MAASDKVVPYTVVQGDSVSLISKKLFGDFSQTQRIIDMNPSIKSNPNLIQPGQTLLVPTTVSKASSADAEDAVVVDDGKTGAGNSVSIFISKYIGWGFGLAAAIVLAYEAHKQWKKNKGGKKSAPKKSKAVAA